MALKWGLSIQFSMMDTMSVINIPVELSRHLEYSFRSVCFDMCAPSFCPKALKCPEWFNIQTHSDSQWLNPAHHRISILFHELVSYAHSFHASPAHLCSASHSQWPRGTEWLKKPHFTSHPNTWVRGTTLCKNYTDTNSKSCKGLGHFHWNTYSATNSSLLYGDCKSQKFKKINYLQITERIILVPTPNIHNTNAPNYWKQQTYLKLSLWHSAQLYGQSVST